MRTDGRCATHTFLPSGDDTATSAGRTVTINGEVVYSGQTSEAKIFYTLIPAEIRSEEMPLFVIFNGGPSVATSSGLLTFGLAPYHLDFFGDEKLKKNPYSFSAIGHLLFIDTRQVGFSYDVVAQPQVPSNRKETFNYYNFSIFTDAGDILLTLLRVMDREPLLRHAKVVILAESYGGARAAMIHSYLSRPAAVEILDNQVFDPVLAAALADHFSLTMPDTRFEDLTVRETAVQFGWQVLLQPGFMVAPVKVYIHTLCGDMAQRDPRAAGCLVNDRAMDLRFPDVGLDALFDAALGVLLSPSGFETLLGISPTQVAGLPASERQGAFRQIIIDDRDRYSEWLAVLGPLPDHDFYHLPRLNTGLVTAAFPTDEVNTSPFIHSLAHIDTFISNAFFDAVVESERIGDALLQASNAMDEPLISSVSIETEGDASVERPGWMQITFTEAMALGGDRHRTIRMPLYEYAGHMIPLTQAGELRDDVRAFLEERGAYW